MYQIMRLTIGVLLATAMGASMATHTTPAPVEPITEKDSGSFSLVIHAKQGDITKQDDHLILVLPRTAIYHTGLMFDHDMKTITVQELESLWHKEGLHVKGDQDVKGKDDQDIKGKDDQDVKGKDDQDVKGKDEQDVKGKDDQDVKGKDEQDVKGDLHVDTDLPTAVLTMPDKSVEKFVLTGISFTPTTVSFSFLHSDSSIQGNIMQPVLVIDNWMCKTCMKELGAQEEISHHE